MAYKRTRHTPSRYQDFIATERREPSKSQVVLYTIVLHTNEEEHAVPLETLESTDGLPLQKEEAVIDQEVVWLHKGKTTYKATIVGSQSCNVGKCSSRKGRSVKSGGMTTAIAGAVPDIDDEDNTAKGSSIPPSDLSDEEQVIEPIGRDSSLRKRHKGGIVDVDVDDEELIVRDTPLRKRYKGSSAGDDEQIVRDTPLRKRYKGSSAGDDEPIFRDTPLRKRHKGSSASDEEPESRPSSFSTSDRELLIAIDRRLRTLEDMLIMRGNSNKINVLPPVSKNSHTACTVHDEDKITIKEETSFCSDGGVDFQLLTGATPDKYALNLMDSLFTDNEMRGHLFFKSARSKSTRELLPQDRVKKLLAAVAARFGKEETRKNFDVIQKKLNQKCRDKDKSESAAEKENLFESLDL